MTFAVLIAPLWGNEDLAVCVRLRESPVTGSFATANRMANVDVLNLRFEGMGPCVKAFCSVSGFTAACAAFS